MSKENKNMKMPKFSLNWTYFIIILILGYLFYSNSGGGSSFQKEVSRIILHKDLLVIPKNKVPRILLLFLCIQRVKNNYQV